MDKPQDSFGSFEAKTHFATLIARVQKGEEITITKHGQPVAKLVPFGKRVHTREERIAAMHRWREISKNIKLGDDITIRELIEADRK
jgi:prevent-host-death family protein